MNILITGSTGYIGSHFLNYAEVRGHKLIIASRKKTKNCFSWVYFDLSNPTFPLEFKENIDCIIHFAANTTRSPRPTPAEEIISAKTLIKTSKIFNANFIFISSQTAHQNSKTDYGLTKWEIEQHVMNNSGIVVRPGLVYGGKTTGLFGGIINLLDKSPIIPLPWPNCFIQPIHMDDLLWGLIQFVERPKDFISGIYFLGESKPLSFNTFIRLINQFYVNKYRLFIPIPTLPITVFIRFLGLIKFPTPSKLDQINSLINLPVMKTSESLKKLNLKLRPIKFGPHPTSISKRSILIKEASLIFRCISINAMPIALLKRYTRVVEKIYGGIPLDIHSFHLTRADFLLIWPMNQLISKKLKYSLTKRIDAATILMETTTEGAGLFLPVDKKIYSSKILFKIFFVILNEIFSRILCLFLFPIHYIYALIRR